MKKEKPRQFELMDLPLTTGPNHALNAKRIALEKCAGDITAAIAWLENDLKHANEQYARELEIAIKAGHKSLDKSIAMKANPTAIWELEQDLRHKK